MVQYGDFSKGKLKMEEEDWRTRDESYKIGDGELPSSDSFCKGQQKKSVFTMKLLIHVSW